MKLNNLIFFILIFFNFINADLVDETFNFAKTIPRNALEDDILPYLIVKINYLKMKELWREEIKNNKKGYELTEQRANHFLKDVNEIDYEICQNYKNKKTKIFGKLKELIRLIDLNFKEDTDLLAKFADKLSDYVDFITF